MKIGFIGTGLMGLPMAKNLLKSGFKLKVFNRSINKAEPLKEFGAEISKTLGEVVKDNDFIITMLTDDNAVDAIMSNSDLLENLKSGSTVIDMSSVKPTTATKYGNSLKSKFKLKVFNRSINKAEPLKEFGAEISKTLGAVSYTHLTLPTNVQV